MREALPLGSPLSTRTIQCHTLYVMSNDFEARFARGLDEDEFRIADKDDDLEDDEEEKDDDVALEDEEEEESD